MMIHIHWIDSLHVSGWTAVEDIESKEAELYHETIGFLFKETSYSYLVVQSRAIDGRVADAIMEIPKVAVIKLTQLKKMKNAKVHT